MGNDLGKYISIKTVDALQLEYSEEEFRNNTYLFGDSYILPRTEGEWQAQSNAHKLDPVNNKEPYLSWEDIKKIWDKVNSIVAGFNNLLPDDKEVPPVNNVVISNSRDKNAAYGSI
ncbi:MAG: hypothetical protein R3D71_08065 [Rickettsiales bacterium]